MNRPERVGHSINPVRIWQGIEASDPPIMRHDYTALMQMAQQLLKARRDRFPAEVSAGRMADTEAALELAAVESLVKNWQFIATGEGEPAGYAADPYLRTALDQALARIAELAGQAGNFTKTLGDQAQAVIALRWHLEPGRDPIALARLNQQLRANARAANSEKEPAK